MSINTFPHYVELADKIINNLLLIKYRIPRNNTICIALFVFHEAQIRMEKFSENLNVYRSTCVVSFVIFFSFNRYLHCTYTLCRLYKKKSDRNADESIKTNVLYVSSYTVSTYIQAFIIFMFMLFRRINTLHLNCEIVLNILITFPSISIMSFPISVPQQNHHHCQS